MCEPEGERRGLGATPQIRSTSPAGLVVVTGADLGPHPFQPKSALFFQEHGIAPVLFWDLGQFHLDAQQLGKRPRITPSKTALRTDADVLDVLFSRRDAPLRPFDAIGVVHQTEAKPRAWIEL